MSISPYFYFSNNILFDFPSSKYKKYTTPKDSYRTRQSKTNSSRCSIVGINGKIDHPLSEYDDEVDEEVVFDLK